MLISENNLKNLIKQYLFENENEKKEFSIKFSNFNIKGYKDSKGIFLTSWPAQAKISGTDVSNVSKEKPLSLEKIKSAYKDVHQKINAEVEKMISKKQTGRKYAYEKDVGYPAIIINTTSKPVSDLFIGMVPESAKKKVLDAIPEGHIKVIYIHPRTRIPFSVDFGVYSKEDGGHAECQQKNKSAFENILNAIGGSVGVYAVGSLVKKDLPGPEASLVKSKDGTHYLFKEGEVENILSRTSDYEDYAIINDCKFINKVIGHTASYKCNKYSLVPASSAGDLASSLRGMIDTFTGDDTVTKSDGSDNCSSLGYKLLHLAKKGKMPGSIDKKLFQFPPHAVNLAKETLK